MALPHALSENDSLWDSQIGPSHLPQLSATLPRSIQHSSLLRRRLAEQEAYQQAGNAGHASAQRPRSIATDPLTIGSSSVRMSMPVDMDDFMDLSDDMSAALGASMICGALGGSDDSMLQALLSSLPEPPATRPDAARMDSLIELADSLPAPPAASSPSSLNASQQHLPPPLSPPTSPKLQTVSKLDLPISPFCSTFTQNTNSMLAKLASSSTPAETVAPAALCGQTANRFPEAVNTKFAAVNSKALPTKNASGSDKIFSIGSIDCKDDDEYDMTPTTAQSPPVAVGGKEDTKANVDSWGNNGISSSCSCSDELTAVRPPSLVLYGPSISELTEITKFSISLETPASSRRNTDEVSLTQQHKEQLQRMSSIESLQSTDSRNSITSSAEGNLLDGEMPPVSPFFSRISNDEVVQARETVKMASMLHRNVSFTLGKASSEKADQALLQRGTWCSPSTKPIDGDLLQRPTNISKARASLAGTLDRWAAISPSSSAQESARESVNIVEEKHRGLETVTSSSYSSVESASEWIGNQKPPMSPMFTKNSLDDLKAVPADKIVKSHPERSRSFQVEVFSLSFAQADPKFSGRPAVVVREITNGKLDDLLDPADDLDVRLALRHYPWVLHQLQKRSSSSNSNSKNRQTAMRMPTRLRTQTLCASRHNRPILSFTATSGSRAVRSDKQVRAIDIDSMVEAYLPQVHKSLEGIASETKEILDADANAGQDAEPGRCFVNTECTPSESSAVTMTGRSAYAESFQSASSEETLRTPAPAPVGISKPLAQSSSAGMRLPISSIRKPARRSDIAPGFKPETTTATSALAPGAPRQLRASASIANLRNSFHERDSSLLGRATETPLGSQAFNQIRSPRSLLPVPVSRRRSEVEALINQANAVLNSGIRRSSAIEPPQNTPARGIRPPRASFPLTFGHSSEARSLRSSIVSPRASVMGTLNTRTSLMSEPEQSISRISSPVSGIRTPTSLTAALSRQHHKLESARGENSAGAGNEISPLTLTPVRSLNAELFASSKNMGSIRGTVSASGLRPPSTIALNGGTVSRIPISGAAGTPTPTMRRQQHQRHSGGSGGGGLANARSSVASPPFNAATGGANGQMSGIRRPPSNNRLRHIGSSNTLRSSGYGQRPAYGSRNFIEGSDSDEQVPASTRRLAPSGSNNSLYGKSRRLGVQGIFKPDDEFLTLRPVHTPDIVPRTIDPSLIERAMTPMLKTNAGILHSSIADMLRSSASINMPTDMAGIGMAGIIANAPDDSDVEDYGEYCARKSLQSPVIAPSALPALPESSPAEDQTRQSHMSPLASPQGSPVIESDASAKTPSRNSFSGRFGRPGFLTRSKAKSTSSGSGPAISGIPIPSFSSLLSSSKISTPKQAPATVKNSSSGKSDASSVRKARSLWTLRGLSSK
ncbi:hypothetical protein FB645_004360 [Coemansia sp. IMI 203386]|nr:hypothetical protein FB645_004360 [Coemansia sp. IMI 203386]